MARKASIDQRTQEVRDMAEGDLEYFIHLVQPLRVLGGVHREVLSWLTSSDKNSHQLLLLPRDHQKSALAAFYVAWRITRDPSIRILYISSTANLATKQLKFIKDILTSDIYRYYWPEMVNKDEGKREKWTETEISVDHPRRRAESVRDPTVFTAGLTTSITGLHCDLSVMDDVVVIENAYTEEGRTKVYQQYSLLASIEGSDAESLVVGTRYDPRDLYNELIEKKIDFFDEDGELLESKPLFEVFQRQVESRGDGTGEFIWPRQRRSDGKWFGFNTEILARKKAQYIDQTQFRAQYYNDPNDLSAAGIQPTYFQYYDRKFLKRYEGKWYFKNERLNVYAAIDFAYTAKASSDYTAIVVVGVDAQNNYYVLDIDRFRTDRNIGDYYNHLLRLHHKWDFRKVRAEVTAAQSVIVKDLKINYILRDGLALIIDEFRPSGRQGTKEERCSAVLQPRYQNLQMWHYLGGYCQTLEEELVLQRPPHDDIKDALASAVDLAVPPPRGLGRSAASQRDIYSVAEHSRFGGIV